MTTDAGILGRARVAMLGASDTADPRTWSGTPFHMGRALGELAGEVRHVGPLGPSRDGPVASLGRTFARIAGVRFEPLPSERTARTRAHAADRRLDELAPDVIVTAAGSSVLAHLKSELPVVYTSDTTARLMFDYHPSFSGLSARARAQHDALEQAAIDRADLLVYPTRWAARSAVDEYGAAPEKIVLAPYGANLGAAPDRGTAVARHDASRCELLFVATNWPIKGGPIALDAAWRLQKRGIDVRLTVVGCRPRFVAPSDLVRLVPYLDKGLPEDRERLSRLYADADFLVMPTRAECYGLTACEASAHGTPTLSTRTGGVPEVVRDGENGYCLELDADGAAWADRIAGLLDDPGALAKLRVSTRDRFESTLNWSVWARTVAPAMGRLLDDP